MTTAFDVAAALLQRAPQGKLPTLTLQKLTFYTFAWYGKVTGSQLFGEKLFAMQHGPIVSELLNLHHSRETYSLGRLEEKVSVVELDDPYAVAVLDAVWSSYSSYNRWDLVEMTHQEEPWVNVWKQAQQERTGSKRISHDYVVEYFANKRSADYELHGKKVHVPVVALLPDTLGRAVTADEFEAMETELQEVPSDAFSGLSPQYRSLLAAL